MFRMIRLGVLALAGYGAWTLYDKYGRQLPRLRTPMSEFAERTTDATQHAARRVGAATHDATDAIKDLTTQVEDAVSDASDDAIHTLHAGPTTSTPPSR